MGCCDLSQDMDDLPYVAASSILQQKGRQQEPQANWFPFAITPNRRPPNRTQALGFSTLLTCILSYPCSSGMCIDPIYRVVANRSVAVGCSAPS